MISQAHCRNNPSLDDVGTCLCVSGFETTKLSSVGWRNTGRGVAKDDEGDEEEERSSSFMSHGVFAGLLPFSRGWNVPVSWNQPSIDTGGEG